MKRVINIKTGSCLVIFFFLAYGFTGKINNRFAIRANEVTVGDPQHPERLPLEIQNAYSRGARKIIIKAGTYMLPNPPNEKNIFLLKGWKDITISAYGTTLILTDTSPNYHAFHLEECNHVTIEGGTVSQTKEPAYQGMITAMDKDSNGNVTVDWQPDAGYPIPASDVTKFPSGVNIVDGKTRKLKTGIPDYYNAAMTAVGDGSFRVTLKKPIVNFGIGDWILGRNGNSPYKFFLANCTNFTIKDITLMRNGFSTIREDGGGGNHILHCTWALGSRPDGATVDPLVSCSADGFYSTNTWLGTDIEDCNFQGILLDDPIAIHGSFIPVISGSANKVVCDAKVKGKLVVGNPLRFTDEKGFIADAKATDIGKVLQHFGQ